MSKMTLGFKVKRWIGVPVMELFLISVLAIVLLSSISREQRGLTQEEGSHTKQFSQNELSFQPQMHQMHRAWRILFSEWDIMQLHFILRTPKCLAQWMNEWVNGWMNEWMNEGKNLWGHFKVNRAFTNRLVTSLFSSSWRQAFCCCSFYFFCRNHRCCLLHPCFLLSSATCFLWLSWQPQRYHPAVWHRVLLFLGCVQLLFSRLSGFRVTRDGWLPLGPSLASYQIDLWGWRLPGGEQTESPQPVFEWEGSR